MRPLTSIPLSSVTSLRRVLGVSIAVAALFLFPTLTFAETSAEADAPTLEQTHQALEFLLGDWVGEGLGGLAEEVWMPPVGGQMMGLFRLSKDGELQFSEIMTVGEFDGKIELRLKHFTDQLHGWETKEQVVSFPLVSVSPGRVEFKGLTYLKDGDGLRIELKLRRGENVSTEVFTFRRR